MNWVTIIILFLVLKKFFFEKINNFLAARQNAIKDAYDNADAVNRKADEKLEAYNKRIANIESEGRDIIKDAKTRADKQAADIVDEAHKRAEDMIFKAQEEIEREKAQAIVDVKNQIVAYALLAAERIMEKDIQIEGQEVFIDKIIEEAGSSEWLN